MLKSVCPCRNQTVVYHTRWGQLYSQPLSITDRLMPNIRQNMKAFDGQIPIGVPHTIPTPVYVLSNSYGGNFAIADQPVIKRPPPWERIIK